MSPAGQRPTENPFEPNTMNYTDCIPTTKFDTAAIARARTLGFPALEPALPDLLPWLKDMNWPVAPPLTELLPQAGPAIIPCLRSALASDDAIWKYWLLTKVCPRLAHASLVELSPDLIRLSTDPTNSETSERVDEAAKVLLSRL